jgi:hypothetical protein
MNDTLEVRARPSDVLAARWRPAQPALPTGLSVRRHLVIVRQPRHESLLDLLKVARHVVDFEPRIRVFVVDGRNSSSYTRKQAAKLPTLLYSAGPLTAFRLDRGKIYAGRPIPNVEQLRQLSAAGLPVPRTTLVTPGVVLDPEQFGKFVVTKPAGFPSPASEPRLVSAADAATTAAKPGERLMVQRFIDTGPVESLYRVVTLFGEPVLALHFRNREPRAGFDTGAPPAARTRIGVAPPPSRDVLVAADEDVLTLARRAAGILPELPMKVCDFLREASTGRLYAIGIDTDGSPEGFATAEELAAPGIAGDLARRFDPLRTAARVLGQRVNAEAE